MADVFISYAHTSAVQAQRAARALREAGYSVWIDDDLPVHRSYPRVIEEQLRSAKAALVIWSGEAAQSEWVMSEANRAREDHKLVQMAVDGVRLPMPFDQIQCADLIGWTGDIGVAGWRKVVASLADLVGLTAPSPPASPSHRAGWEPSEPMLAVLAFDNLSGDPDMTYFSDGISEEIQNTVARGTELKVIGRASSFQFRGADKAAAHVAAELDATHVLDGSVRRSGSRVRISAQLIECAQETTLWSERFDRDLTDIFALQDEIAAAVAAALKTAFAPAAPVGPIDPKAFDLYLRSRGLFWGGNFDLTPQIALLEEAVGLAPRFAAAWAGLANTRARILRLAPQGAAYSAQRGAVILAAQAALAIEPASGGAYLALSRLEPFAGYAEQEAHLLQGLSLAPYDLGCLSAMARFCLNVGRHRDAARYAEQAFRLDPLDLMAAFWQAVIALLSSHPDADRMFENFGARWPGEEVLAIGELTVSFVTERWERVDAVVARLRERGLKGPGPRALVELFSNLRHRDPTTLATVLDQLRARLAETGTVEVQGVLNLAVVGLTEEAFEIAGRASFSRLFDPDGAPPSRGFEVGNIFANPRFMNDVRFVGLCAKLGLCAYWADTGRWPDCADSVSYDFRSEVLTKTGKQN